MRLIDADAAIERITESLELVMGDSKWDAVTIKALIRNALKSERIAPTLGDDRFKIKKRGRWIKDEDTYAGPGVSNFKCSVCGKFGGTWLNEIADGDMYKFCPWCGAKMGEGDNDENAQSR